MRLFAEPLSAKLVWDEGELVALIVAGHRHTVVEQLRRWRVEADWWKGGVSRDYVTLRTADGLVCDVYGDRRSGTWWLQRGMHDPNDTDCERSSRGLIRATAVLLEREPRCEYTIARRVRSRQRCKVGDRPGGRVRDGPRSACGSTLRVRVGVAEGHRHDHLRRRGERDSARFDLVVQRRG